jgi:YD repeat-containing protein
MAPVGHRSRREDLAPRREGAKKTHDASGNRTVEQAPMATTYFTWDEDERLTKAEPVAGAVNFIYNADGRRIAKDAPSESTKFIWDFKRLLQETDAARDAEISMSNPIAAIVTTSSRRPNAAR